MKKIETEIQIQATASKVWEVLTDFDRYPDWNPFVKDISGPQQVGQKLNVRLQPPESSEMTFTPILLNFDVNQELRWKGKLFISGLFDGEHYFRLSPVDKQNTSFIHGEHFSGLLVGLFGGILKKTEKGFEQMNAALKAECEKSMEA